jgi:erythromycin esterase-like protein
MVTAKRRWWRGGDSDETAQLASQIVKLAQPLTKAADLDPLLGRIGQARYVLLGEASHGTSEFYTWRTAISKRLIGEKGFSFIAVEGDWPDCYRINRYVRGFRDSGENARDVLHNFQRWPTWMWANEEVLDLTEWLRDHNRGVSPEQRVGFYGLDVYSLWDSLYQIMGYFHRAHPELLDAARKAFHCFQPYGEDVHDYAEAARWLDSYCEDEVVTLLSELRRAGSDLADNDSEAHFNAEQNAWVVRNAEHYYRTMVRGDAESWNIRDTHMVQTLERLMQHYGPQAKAIVWEHNTHIGDARFTDMSDEGMVNVGQLVREAHEPDDVVVVGFGSHHGSVIAGRAWNSPMEQMPVSHGHAGSWEDVLHQAGVSDKLLVFRDEDKSGLLAKSRGHRAIGVVYRPLYEAGNYVPTVLPRRYDAFLFLDETQALHPLHEVQPLEEGEVPETFPTGV